MPGKIVILDRPGGPIAVIANKLAETGYSVAVHNTHQEVLDSVHGDPAQLLIAVGANGSGTSLAEELYDAVNIPIMLVLSTAGDETMTFLRRHPGVIGVFYTPVNVDKFVQRVRSFFND